VAATGGVVRIAEVFRHSEREEATMGFFGELGSRLGERKRVIGAALAFACIAVASFLAGTWAGSPEVLAPRPVTNSAPHPNNPPTPGAAKPGEMCCGMSMPDMSMPSAMPMPSGMPMMPSGMPMMPMPSKPAS